MRIEKTKSQDYILASKRAAVTFVRDAPGAELHADMAPGGTANVVADLAVELNVDWIASAMTEGDKEAARLHPQGLSIEYNQTEYAEPVTMQLLTHDVDVFDDMQNVITADLLWHSHNALWDSWRAPSFDDTTQRAWTSFTAFSAQFADAIELRVEQRNNAKILVQDYQLVLVPRMLRAKNIDNPILLFIHIPWPEPDYWRMTPKYVRTAVIEGMLGSDCVAFFATRWCRNFLRCVEELMPEARVDYERQEILHQGRTVAVKAMPLGYSQQALDARAGYVPDAVQSWLGSAKYIVHSGRTDPMKNAHRAILGYRMAALRDPGVRAHKLLVRTNPNRLYVQDNADYFELVKKLAAETNEVLGTDAVLVVCENDVRATIGCLRQADIVMINSTIDGQNLTVFEASMTNTKHAPVILSERTGAAECMSPVCDMVNPFDISELCGALIRNVAKSTRERAFEAEERRAVAAKYTLRAWVAMQVKHLDGLGRSRGGF